MENTAPVTESLAKGVISRWRKTVEKEYLGHHSNYLSDEYATFERRSKSMAAAVDAFRQMSASLLATHERGKGKDRVVSGILMTMAQSRTDPSMRLVAHRFDRKGHKQNELPIRFSQHYLVRIAQAHRCTSAEQLKQVFEEVMLVFWLFYLTQTQEVSAADRYADNRTAWLVTRMGAHLVEIENGLPAHAITYIPRESWDFRREQWWADALKDSEALVSNEHGDISLTWEASNLL